ncbi:trichothecene 3-O-acetyltransferase [Sporothrix schenckii 1099-18]|uniref:Trichothecene 3-O-acetyltransferase n=1 Tax=Sporothrix schenckii 1099-18 TaxID=1397361 RepID=A0A0F2MJV2_SPOSC|nr:trichothecene 3-O-acetyltransferase [Sporothrix schenckii 1099-18]KJR89968.1 trichothecene 3-O-acetyltransferase [Sporothrix schenckii 1099-18]
MAASSLAANTSGPAAPTKTLVHLDAAAAAQMDVGVFGQQAGMQIYTQIAYVFAAAPERAAVVATLQTGLARLVAAFPWLGGQIVRAAGADGRRHLHFAPLPDGPPPLVVTDAPPTMTMAALRAAQYPFRLLDESVVAPRRTLPSPAEPAERPVLLVQATFLHGGGLVLTVVGHHAAMDMAGQTAVVEWLAQACRGEAYSADDLAVGNGDRAGAVDLLDAGAGDPFALIPEQVRPVEEGEGKGPQPGKAPETRPPITWSYFHVRQTALEALKDEATRTLPKAGGVRFVSTNDALSAFLWQSILRARRARLTSTSTSSSLSTFARAVNVRRHLGLPPNYPALLQNMTIHTHPVAWVCDASLGEASAQLRAALLQPDRLRERTRALATCLEMHPDQAGRRLSFVGHVDTAAGGLMLSSWTTAPGVDTDFGLGGQRPVAVRRPQFTPVESLAFLMPADRDGTVAAGVSLRAADLANLQADPEFTKYAQYVG